MHPNDLRYCRSCGETKQPVVGPGTEVHAGRLLCRNCGRFLTWIKKTDASLFNIPKRQEKKEQPIQARLF